MLITKEEIIKKLNSIPPLPESVKDSIKYLKAGDLQKAADSVNKDIVLKKRIETIVNSAYFGFSNKLTDTRQMFSALGLEMARSVVFSYMVSLLAPKEWKIFKKLDFQDFQTAFLANAKEAIIIETNEDIYKKYADSLAIIPSVICLIDELLGDKIDKVDLLMENSNLDYGKILKRFTGFSLFSLASFVAKKWGVDKPNIDFIQYIECETCDIDDETIQKIAGAVHLEFFYLVSKPNFFELNSFIEFNPQVIEIADKLYKKLSENE